MQHANTTAHTFTVDPQIIYRLISAQSSSLSKAILEGCMNAIDAGATSCTVDLSQTNFRISDDGDGFKSKEDILDNFGKFGRPHEEGDAVFGKYRLGRGQLFTYAKTEWRSGRFVMRVDLQSQGLGYHIDEISNEAPGCTVNGVLYEELTPSELANVLRDLKKLVAYAQIPIIVNDEQYNQLPEELKWDIENEDVYIKFKSTGGVSVYNLGVFVKEYPSYYYGSGATVVSKKQLDVNMARTDILEKRCAVWKKISSLLKDHNRSDAKKSTSKRMTDEQRQSICLDLKYGDFNFDDAMEKPLLIDAAGRKRKLKTLLECYNMPVTMPEKHGDRVADVVLQQKLAYVLSPKTLELFEVDSLIELIENLKICAERDHKPQPYRNDFNYNLNRLENLNIKEFSEVSKGISSDICLLAEKDLKPAEKYAVKAIQASQYYLKHALADVIGEQVAVRKIRVGVSETNVAWTNGTTYIAIDRKYLKMINRGMTGSFQLTHTLVHEYLHDDCSDSESHLHDDEFNERFRQVLEHPNDPVGTVAHKIYLAYLRSLQRANIRPQRDLLKFADLDHEFDRQFEEDGVKGPTDRDDGDDKTVKDAAKLTTKKVVAAKKPDSQFKLF